MLRYLPLALLFFIFGNWILSFTSIDEGRNMDVVRNMLESGNYLVPYYDCHERFAKPPLLYWLVLLSSSLFGMNEFSARLISGLSATGVSLLTYMMGRELFDEEIARRSFLISLTIVHLWIESRAVVPEMTLTFFMLLGVFLFLKERFVLGWLSLGLAFLTKGPIGVLLPVPVSFILRKDAKFLNLKGIILFFLVGGSWYYLMFYRFGYHYFYHFFIYENIMRFTGQKHIHIYPFWYYIPVLIISTVFYVPVYHRLLRVRGEFLRVVLWFLFVVGFFSLSRSKLHHYILFSYPAIAIILSGVVGERYIRKAIVLAGIALLLLTGGAYVYEHERFVPKAVPLVRNFQGEVYFYGAEVSPLVYYSGKCIKNYVSGAEGLVVTKEENRERFKRCRELVRGREFDGNYVLLKCER